MRDHKTFLTEVCERKYFTAGQEGDQIFQVCGFFHLEEESWLEDETKVGESGWRVKRRPAHRHSEKVGTRTVG